MTSDDLDWSAIQTPAGRATKVPALLADLEGRDPKIRAKGVQWLRRLSIFEGDTTPVAVPLAPRLVTIVKPKAPALAETLRLLADLLVCGSADAWLMRGYDVRIPAFEKAPPSQPGRALYEAIAVGVDRYIACLTHADVAVRANVAPLLAYLSRETASIEPALFERLPKEKDPAARGALALALAHQGQYAGDGRARDLLIEQSRSKDVLAAVGAAAGLVATLGAAAPDHVAQVLLEAVAKQRKKVDAFPFHGGIPANLAVIVAARFAGDRGDVGLAERLVNAAAKLPTAFWALGSLIDAAFAREPRPTPRAPGELDEKQIVAVRAVAASEHVERLTSGLDRAGLVADAAALACVAGDPPSTSLARVVDGEPLLRSAARALRTKAAEAKWHATLASMSDDERIAIARDAHCHPLRIWSLPRPSDLDPGREDFLVDDRSTRALLRRAMMLTQQDLERCAPEALLAALASFGKQTLQPPAYLAALTFATCEAFARAGKEVPPAVDARFRRINPGSSFDDTDAVRSALEKLPLARREAVILDQHFWHHSHPDPDEGPIGGAWLTADLAPTAKVAKHIVAEIVSWEGGAAPYPEEKAVALLRGIGAPAKKAIEGGLAESPVFAAVLERALAKKG